MYLSLPASRALLLPLHHRQPFGTARCLDAGTNTEGTLPHPLTTAMSLPSIRPQYHPTAKRRGTGASRAVGAGPRRCARMHVRTSLRKHAGVGACARGTCRRGHHGGAAARAQRPVPPRARVPARERLPGRRARLRQGGGGGERGGAGRAGAERDGGSLTDRPTD